jgi:hypothetical protein
MKYAKFDSNGLPVAFYAPGVNKIIPADAIQISDEQWQEFLNNPGRRKWNGSAIVEHIPPGPTDEEKLAKLRTERDRKLSVCDFTQLSDAPFDSAGKAEWAAYRQTLRDLPETVADLDNIEWPVVPGEI